jgi:transcription elongation factor GreB
MSDIEYFTSDGLMLIKQEFNMLWNEIRPDVVKKLAWAASLGDRSENADYQYNKQLLRQVDKRIYIISKVINKAEVLDVSKKIKDLKVVAFGAYVEIERETDGALRHVRIVNSNEAYDRDGFISYHSPMAKALMNKTIDDDVLVKTDKGAVTWFINKISDKHEDWFGEIAEPKFHFSNEEKRVDVKILTDEEIKKINEEYLKTLVK